MREISAMEVTPGMVLGFYAPGGRTAANLISTHTVSGVHMEPVWDRRRNRYGGQRVTLSYYTEGKTPAVLNGSDTVIVH